jgi:hypothetical protein
VLQLGISSAMILVCDVPGRAVLRGSFAIPFANFFTGLVRFEGQSGIPNPRLDVSYDPRHTLWSQFGP